MLRNILKKYSHFWGIIQQMTVKVCPVVWHDELPGIFIIENMKTFHQLKKLESYLSMF